MTSLPAERANANPREFSIIIPLEFHRGHADQCVRAWTREVRYPRDRYEVILAAPEGFPRDDLARLQALLGVEDRIIHRPDRHDMPLCAAAAEVAGGSVLFFTESHCLPDPDVLSVSTDSLVAHPEWSGLSCRSLRVAHNSLAIVEADMYEADIAAGMAPGHWRRILDQCFVVRREPYFAAGGFDPTLGHFAEWMLAARFWRMGLALGYVPEAQIHHHYVGELGEWTEFTRDFIRGEMTAWARGEAVEFADLFGSVREWTSREDWRASTARRMLRVSVEDAAARRDARAIGAAIARWLPAAVSGIGLARVRAAAAWQAARCRALWHARTAAKETLRASVMASMDALTRVERLRGVASSLASAGVESAESHEPHAPAGAWEPVGNTTLGGAGLHQYERVGEQPLVWSEPAAMVQLPLAAGTYDVDIEWLVVRPPTEPPEPRFYLNERPLTECRIGPSSASLRFPVAAAGSARLAWTCRPFSAPRDARRLGLPIRRISWRRDDGVSRAGLEP